MPTANTRTDITKMALREITAVTIVDWEEDSPVGDITRDLWGQAVRKALSRHEWRFAMKQAKLSKSSNTPTARHDYIYTLPGDFIRLATVADNDAMSPVMVGKDYRQFHDGIYTSAEDVYIEYVFYDEATSSPAIGTWPAWFIDVFSADYAAVLAGPLKSDRSRRDMEKLAQERLSEDKSIDSSQQPVIHRPRSRWASGMHGNRGNVG